MLKLKLHTCICTHQFEIVYINQALRPLNLLYWNKFHCFFSPSRELVPFIKDSKSSRLFLQFTEGKLYSIYVPLLIYKIDSQNKYFTKSCVIVEQCWSIVTSVLFVTVQVYIRDCTMVNMYPLLLFGGGSISVDLEKGNFVLTIDDGWIRFLADSTKVYFYCCISSTTVDSNLNARN